MEVPTVQEFDIEVVKKAIEKPVLNIPDWVLSLDLENIQGLDKFLDSSTNGGNTDQTIRDILKHDMIYAELEESPKNNNLIKSTLDSQS